jgi:hypothetical protein
LNYFIIRFVIVACLGLIVYAARNEHHKHTQGRDTYKLTRALRLIMSGCAVTIIALFFAVSLKSHGGESWIDVAGFLTMVVLMTVFALWCLLYRITIDDQGIHYSAFFKVQIPFGSVSRIAKKYRRGPYAYIYSNKHWPICIFGVPDYDALIEDLERRCPHAITG